jgi:hypothetical protein
MQHWIEPQAKQGGFVRTAAVCAGRRVQRMRSAADVTAGKHARNTASGTRKPSRTTPISIAGSASFRVRSAATRNLRTGEQQHEEQGSPIKGLSQEKKHVSMRKKIAVFE